MMEQFVVPVALEQERWDALQLYLAKEQTTIEAALQQALDELYLKYVPLSVQEYLRLCQTRDEAESAECPRMGPGENEAGERAGVAEPPLLGHSGGQCLPPQGIEGLPA